MQVMQVNYQDLALYIYVQIHNSTPVQQNTIYIDLLLAHLFWRAYKQLKHWARVCPKNRKALASRLLVGSTQYTMCVLSPSIWVCIVHIVGATLRKIRRLCDEWACALLTAFLSTANRWPRPFLLQHNAAFGLSYGLWLSQSRLKTAK